MLWAVLGWITKTARGRYTAFLSIPLLTAFVSIWDKSTPGAVIYLLIGIASVLFILRFFCTHCPHYRRDEKHLKCIFFWEMPKVFMVRPEPPGFLDKTLAFACPALVLAYPLYWLFQEPGLLMVYLLSVTVFGASIRRNECPRCIYTDCPVNAARQ